MNEILDKMNFIFRDNLDNIISAYHKYKTYYDRKARPTTDEVDQNENDNLDQDLVEEEPSEEIIPQVQEQHSPQVIPPEVTTRIDYQQVETDHNNFRPPRVRFGTQEEIILPPPPR